MELTGDLHPFIAFLIVELQEEIFLFYSPFLVLAIGLYGILGLDTKKQWFSLTDFKIIAFRGNLMLFLKESGVLISNHRLTASHPLNAVSLSCCHRMIKQYALISSAHQKI